MSGARTGYSPTQLRLSALLLLSLMAGVVVLTVAMYNKSFTDSVTVTVEAERAGLQMNRGTIVQLRGVDVGRIKSATRRSDGTAAIELSLYPDLIDKIPDNVDVSLAQLTAFGNKSVQLTLPDEPSGRHLDEGDVITAGHVTVEANEVLDNLERLLTKVQPSKVNKALSALAGAVDGRGEALGETLTVADRYLRRINNDLPTLRRNFIKGVQVLRLYSDVTPDLLAILDNGTTTAKTLTQQADELESALVSTKAVADSGSKFIALNGDDLIQFLTRLSVTTGLLEEYSPEISCFLQGADYYQTIAQKPYGGIFAAANVVATLELGTGPYKNPENLPVMGADVGPECHGMPSYHGGPLPQSMNEYVDKGGPNPYPEEPQINDQPLTTALFGPLAGDNNP